MRLTAKPLLVTLTFAVAALTAPTASAQDVQLVEEATGEHCPSLSLSGTDVNGGCLLHATSEGTVELRKHVFGIESHITRCNDEFHARVDDDGTGYILEQQLSTGVSGSCTREACNETAGEATPWEFTIAEGTPVEGTEFITTNFCVEPVGGGTDEACEIDLPLQFGASATHSIELGHATELSAHGITGFRCELVGHWNTEIGGSHDSGGEQEIMADLETADRLTPDNLELDFSVGPTTKMITWTNNVGHAIHTEDSAGALLSGAGETRFEVTKGCDAPTMIPKGQTCEMSVLKMSNGPEAHLTIIYDVPELNAQGFSYQVDLKN